MPSKLSTGEVALKLLEITIKQAIPRKNFNKVKVYCGSEMDLQNFIYILFAMVTVFWFDLDLKRRMKNAKTRCA